MSEENALFWIWFSRICLTGCRQTDLILDFFGNSAKDIYEADEETYKEIIGIEVKPLERLCNKSLDEAKEIYAYCQKEGVGILTPASPLYPSRLVRLPNRPVLLYYRGQLRELDEEACVAVVGTRSMTDYGAHTAYRFGYDLAKAGAVVVSGMAKGVDGMAHCGAIEACGYTVAVLGCGIDRAYPAEHAGLMKMIEKTGLVLTEYRPFTQPYGYNFPTRNRIISGLSLGTVVVEASSSSGALITAETTVRQGRDLYAVPGKVGERNSFGPNSLLRAGAKIVTGAADVLRAYLPFYKSKINLENIPTSGVPFPKNLPSYLQEGIGSLRKAAPQGDGSDGEELKRRKPATEGKSGTRKRSGKAGGAVGSEAFTAPDGESSRTAVSPLSGEADSSKNGTGTAEPILPDLSGLSEEERTVLSLFPRGTALTADRVAGLCGRSIHEILPILTVLEISGKLAALPGGRYTAVFPNKG